MSRYYPVFLDLRGRKCVLVGGGEMATRKVQGLLDAGAELHVISPHFDASFPDIPDVRRHQREFQPSDLDEAAMVICATEDAQTCRQVQKAAEEKQVLINVVDSPEQCDFIAPAVFRRGQLCIAVSTGGASPSLAARLARDMGKHFGPKYAEYLELLSQYRGIAQKAVPDAKKRMALLTRLSDKRLVRLLAEHGRKAVEQRIRNLIEEFSKADESERG